MTEEKIGLDAEAQEAADLAVEKALAAPPNVRSYFMIELPVQELKIDPKLQRRLSVERVNSIAGDYRPEAIGVLTASRREDGKYYALDGQHRQAALALLGKGSMEVQVKAFEDLSPAEEAVLFRLLNNTKHPQPLDIFRVKLIERDPLAIKMFNVLVKHEWRLRGGIADGNFGAVKTLERLFALDVDLAETSVSLLSGAWGNRYGALNDSLLAGMGKLLLFRGDKVNGSHMIKKLTAVPGGPREVINKATTLRDAMRLTKAGAVAMVLVDIYNKDLRSNKLDPWTEK